MKNLSVIAAAVLFLAGCALEEKGRWVKPDSTEAQWKQDNYQCTRDATYYVYWVPYASYHWRGHHWPHSWHHFPDGPRLDRYLYEMCLEAKGYAWKPDQ